MTQLPLIALALMFASAGGHAATTARVRPSVLAGTWYPGDRDQLALLVDHLLDLAAGPGESDAPPPRAVIVPHAGYAYSGPTAAKAIARLRGQRFTRVIILAPTHYSPFSGLSIADVDAFSTPLGEVPLDRAAIEQLRRSPLVGSVAEAERQEHSIEIELPLLQRALAPGWSLVPVLVGRLDEQDYQTAAELLRPLADARTLVLVSSDFTHYGSRFGYQPFPLDDQTPARLRELDGQASARIQARDQAGLLALERRTGITVCGIRPIAILLGMLPPEARVERLDYQTSGALTGDYRNSVSYAAFAISAEQPLAATADDQGMGPTAAELELLHRLALLGIDQAVLGKGPATESRLQRLVASLPARLKEPGGAFVTLKRGGELRGCIGYILPREPLYLAVLENGDNAARRDPRFSPVTRDELAGLSVEVSVLTPPRPIAGYQAFEVGRQGVILSKSGRSAVFLPEVATEQGWDRAETLTHLALKAGLPSDAWRSGAEFQVFESSHYTAPYSAEQ